MYNLILFHYKPKTKTQRSPILISVQNGHIYLLDTLGSDFIY